MIFTVQENILYRYTKLSTAKPSKDSMYYMTAFAQHYLDISPFVDFTKCIYVALSFAIKGRETADSDIVIYTAEDIGDDDTSSDMNEVK